MNDRCAVTHRQLMLGNCPWCNRSIVDGSIAGDLAPDKESDCRWSIDAMLGALGTEDVSGRCVTLDNARRHLLQLPEAILVLAKGLDDSESLVRQLSARVLARRGNEGSSKEVDIVDRMVGTELNELAIHIVLLGHYSAEVRGASNVARIARRRHLIWVVENRPQTEFAGMPDMLVCDPAERDLYNEVRVVWIRQVRANAKNTTVLGNAAAFLSLHEPKSIAAKSGWILSNVCLSKQLWRRLS